MSSWALVHWDSTWLGEVRGSIEWLSTTVSPDAGPWTNTWPSWKATIEHHHPGRWKALLRRAQGRAVQQEAWHAARMHQAGLMVRQLQMLGALLDSEALDATDRHYCCVPCKCVFDSYNKWSLHAFKKHGRVMQGRGLLQGSQCQACLRHFRTNVRLCRHLRFTPSCRLKLQQAGYAVSLNPGSAVAGHRTRQAHKHLFSRPLVPAYHCSSQTSLKSDNGQSQKYWIVCYIWISMGILPRAPARSYGVASDSPFRVFAHRQIGCDTLFGHGLRWWTARRRTCVVGCVPAWSGCRRPTLCSGWFLRQ